MSRYHRIDTANMVNGTGIRTVIWFSGCPHHCKGCHNPESWDFNGGEYKNNDILLEEINRLQTTKKAK